MEDDDRQVTTAFTVQPSFHHWHSTNRVSWSVTIVGERRGEVCSFADNGNASWYSVFRVPMVEWRLDCEDYRHLTVVGLHDTGPWSWARPYALVQALQSTNLRVGLGNRKRAILLYFSRHRWSEQHCPKQKRRAPRFFFFFFFFFFPLLPSVTMCQHCSCCVVARLARPFSRPCVFLVLFCVFNVLFHSKHRPRLTGYIDWQAARMCPLRWYCKQWRWRQRQG